MAQITFQHVVQFATMAAVEAVVWVMVMWVGMSLWKAVHDR